MFQNDNTFLRPLIPSDITDVIVTYINDPEVNQYLARVLPLSKDVEIEWVSSLAHSKTDVVFGIFHQNDTQESSLIGTCGLHHINYIDHNASMGIAIFDKKYWEKQHGSASFKLLIAYAFNSLNLHRLYSRAIAYNERSIALHKRCGFIEEGRQREAVYKNGAYHDDILFGLLRSEYIKM